MSDKERKALKKLLELRSRDKTRKSKRTLEEAIRIGLIAKILFNEYYEVVSWGKERILRLRI